MRAFVRGVRRVRNVEGEGRKVGEGVGRAMGFMESCVRVMLRWCIVSEAMRWKEGKKGRTND